METSPETRIESVDTIFDPKGCQIRFSGVILGQVSALRTFFGTQFFWLFGSIFDVIFHFPFMAGTGLPGREGVAGGSEGGRVGMERPTGAWARLKAIGGGSLGARSDRCLQQELAPYCPASGPNGRRSDVTL